METTWTLAERREELQRCERAARAAGLKKASVTTYVDRSTRVVRWLGGDYQFEGARDT